MIKCVRPLSPGKQLAGLLLLFTGLFITSSAALAKAPPAEHAKHVPEASHEHKHHYSAVTHNIAHHPTVNAAHNSRKVACRAYWLAIYPTGKVLRQMNGDARLSPASLTKLMTAYVAFRAIRQGKLRLNQTAHAASMPRSSMGLKAGNRPTVNQVLHGMLIPSGNDAAGTQTAMVPGIAWMPVR